MGSSCSLHVRIELGDYARSAADRTMLTCTPLQENFRRKLANGAMSKLRENLRKGKILAGTTCALHVLFVTEYSDAFIGAGQFVDKRHWWDRTIESVRNVPISLSEKHHWEAIAREDGTLIIGCCCTPDASKTISNEQRFMIAL